MTVEAGILEELPLRTLRRRAPTLDEKSSNAANQDQPVSESRHRCNSHHSMLRR
jgi:hypothetical protein